MICFRGEDNAGREMDSSLYSVANIAHRKVNQELVYLSFRCFLYLFKFLSVNHRPLLNGSFTERTEPVHPDKKSKTIRIHLKLKNKITKSFMLSEINFHHEKKQLLNT